MQLEVLVTNADEAKSAQQAGATRVELAADIERGGLTPSEWTVYATARAVSIPVHVMLRPHDNGFQYGAVERKTMLNAAAGLRDLGATAVVFGALDERGRVAAGFVEEVAEAARLPVIFHRAFDSSHNLSAAYATLAGIRRVERVLTAGGASRACDGRRWLRELGYGNTFPTVVACGDIHENDVGDMVRAGVREVLVGRAARTNGALDPAKVERLATALCAPRYY